MILGKKYLQLLHKSLSFTGRWTTHTEILLIFKKKIVAQIQIICKFSHFIMREKNSKPWWRVYTLYIEDKSHWFKVSSSSSNARAQGFSSSTFSMEEYHTESQNDLLAGYLNKVYDTKLTHIKRKVNSVVICILPSQELNKEKHSSVSWEISQPDISHFSCDFSHRELSLRR